jgi:WD40-like Beta Propeller Repeat
MDVAIRLRQRVPRLGLLVIALAVGVAAVAALVVHERGHPRAVSIRPPARVTLVYARPVGKSLTPRSEVVFSATPTGGRPVRLAEGANPLVSPDGRWVAYDGGGLNQAPSVRLVSTLGGISKVVTALGEPVVWSPNSRLVVVQGSAGVVLVDVHSLRVRRLRVPEASGGFTFSPDGTTLAYQHSTGAGSDIFIINLHSGVIRQLTRDGRSGSPLWGSEAIAFERFGPDRCANCHGDVWLMSPTGGDARQLTHTHAGIYPAAWSDDGTRMLAAYPATHNGQLYAVDVASGSARPLTPFVGDLFPQGLSRNGRTVLAAIGCGGTISPYGLVETIPFTGGHPTVIIRGPCRASSNF